ncbi:YceD family protein [Nitrobacter winogradskyi]|uniref:Uncharacterized metal-binding protein YceD (DUF177 family) n=2 Tax=Nitrobacter winogradskyi TaxID=913 RepID=A0ACC6AGA5_NITWI|nr:DUF177 domain-containing protein [Nitrobacter winogradskyi]MCP1998543.1 uncharacterized metal-binding protein YceD (DUF177 family) [Nitrobacter winogradskyi]GEC15483.1 phosphodiesterase [Nitrobacter winogradskyi]
MNAKDRPDTSTIPNPWISRATVAQIPETGLHRDIEADESVRMALAKIAGVRDVAYARASFDLTPERDERVHVRGRVSARVGQTCVVSLDPIENDVVEDIDLVFVPEGRIREFVVPINDEDGVGGEVPEAPEPIVNGVIDLGRLATDVLFLGIDPYPRKPDAVFAPPASAMDPEDHPFAALKDLKVRPNPPEKKKPARD